MMKKIYKLVVLLLLCQTYVFAQNISVTGKVTDSDNLPLPGVSVKVSGAAQGTSTDANGNFTISVPGTGTLVFTSIGFTTQTVPVQGRTTLNIRMAADAQNLEGVVVTALGIERSSKSLTYNTTNISADELNAVKSSNVLNALAGKAAGVFVTQGNGGPGSAPRIIMRGNKSITGNNQPLYVVDGIPLSFNDFNQEDVESMQVLQGASASALYGSAAANGVILITTKKGKLGATNVDFASTAMYENPLLLPDVQTDYGQGLGGVANTTINDSWGPKISNGSDKHIKDFFRTGANLINSLSVSSGNASQRIYFSYANTTSKAVIPGYDYNRHNASLRGNTGLFKDKVTLNAGINYISNYTQNQNSSGWVDSPMFGLYLFPTGANMDLYSANGGAKFDPARNMWVQNWPFIKNEHSSNENPYWLTGRGRGRDNYGNRAVFNVGAKWNITNWLNFSARTTYTNRWGNDEIRDAASGDPTNTGANGGYSKSFSNSYDSYTELLLNANRNLGKNFTLNASAGFINDQGKDQSISNSNNGSTNTLAYPNQYSVFGLTGEFNSSESLSKSLSQAVLGTASLGWKETLFLDVTARNEWTYTVDKPFFYPSVGLGYILTETIGSNDVLSFAKIRGSYAEVGNGLPVGANQRNPFYTVGNNENINGRGSLPFFSGLDTATLNPERTKSWEIGTDLRFFKDKLNLSVTYYNGTTEDQVFQIGAPAGAGASNFWINGGTIQNRGIEAALSYNAKLGAVSWTPSFNFSRNTNRIKSLSNLLTNDRFTLSSGNRLTNLYLLRPGSSLLNGRSYGAYHDLFGKVYVRDANGNITYNATTGLPIISPAADQYAGNANPDFLLNMNNQFSYKRFTLSFLLDGRFGGLVSSSTEQWLDYKGLSQRSGDARNSSDGLMDIGGPKRVSPELYYGFISAKADGGALVDAYLFDSTNIRLRELALGFQLPKFTNAIRNMSLTLVGRNLFFLTKEAPFDPELANGTGNAGQGFESFQIPSLRSIGLTLRAGL